MAAGVPVMATDCGGAPEVVGQADLLFPLRDAETLAHRLAGHFAADAGARARIAAEGMQRLEARFSDAAARQRFFALPMVRDVLGDARP
jgi:hypothetical protein